MQGELGAQVTTGAVPSPYDTAPRSRLARGWLLACLYAHGDKLPGNEFALYDAAARLERAIGTITHFASECRSEIQRHLPACSPGRGGSRSVWSTMPAG
jgi:hypothetical protein